VTNDSLVRINIRSDVFNPDYKTKVEHRHLYNSLCPEFCTRVMLLKGPPSTHSTVVVMKPDRLWNPSETGQSWTWTWCPRSRTLACSHTAVRSYSLPFNSVHHKSGPL